MKCESKYRIVLLDHRDGEIGDREADNLKQAKAEAKYMMSERYAHMAETDDLGWVRCRIIRTKDGEIMEDYEREATNCEST